MVRVRNSAGEERGQILAIFAIALVAIIAMTGLVLDGGSAFVQRRDEQNVADAAALAGVYAYLQSGQQGDAIAAAQAAAAANGYTHGVGGVVVNVSMGTGVNNVGAVTVTVTKPHRNNFAGVVGMSSWDVSATATAQGGPPNAAVGAMPIIFNEEAFDNGWGPTEETSFGEPSNGNADVPQSANQFNWTVFCMAQGGGSGSCNGDSSTVAELMRDENERGRQVTLNDDIGPLNAGSHTTLFDELSEHVGTEFPVSIVNDAGEMQGWAMFHLTGSLGGSTKEIRGYFVAPVNWKGIYIAAGGGAGSSDYGATSVYLTN